jgi:hypothetical protein
VIRVCRTIVHVSLLAGCLVATIEAQTNRPERPRLPLDVLGQVLAVCRLPPQSPVPEWATASEGMLTVSRTPAELSIVAGQDRIPAGVQCERDYRAFRVRGPLPLNLVGILASIANPLAEAGLSIFAISTYDTDYVLVKAAALDSAIAALRGAGHVVTHENVTPP